MVPTPDEQQVIDDCWLVVQEYRKGLDPVKSAVFRSQQNDNTVGDDKSNASDYNLGVDILPDSSPLSGRPPSR